eukprot:14714442-Ditylum_brightwellii.AAC.1
MKEITNPVRVRRCISAVKGSDGNKDLHAIINKKIAAAFSHKEKKELNKFEALSIISDSNKDKDSSSNSRVSYTSNEDMDSE